MTKPISSKQAVNAFLTSQYEKKTETEQKQLAKAKEDGDSEKFAKLSVKLSEVRDKFSANTWLTEATNTMVKQLRFGTHISKGIHSSSKGDTVNFHPKHDITHNIIGTHSCDLTVFDASGNAAALPLASFFDFPIGDGVKIRDLILNDDTDFIASLAPHPDTARDYHRIFKDALQNIIESPVTHTRNKQMLWVTNPYSAKCADDLNYITIVPLYPSVLTNEVYHCVWSIRYSEENKISRDNRFKKTAEQHEYCSMPDMATTILGGTKPQGVGYLNNRQYGRNYLLPSVPPSPLRADKEQLSKFTKSIFSEALEVRAHHAIAEIFKVVKDKNNPVKLRDKRKHAIDDILHILFSVAENMKTNLPAGWSNKYQLAQHEKLWLDPQRAELEGEEEFKQQRNDDEWHEQIIQDFARWLNRVLQKEFSEIKYDFGDSEHNNWESEIEDMIKQYERLGKGVFL